jgi:hypothetical protein
VLERKKTPDQAFLPGLVVDCASLLVLVSYRQNDERKEEKKPEPY